MLSLTLLGLVLGSLALVGVVILAVFVAQTSNRLNQIVDMNDDPSSLSRQISSDDAPSSSESVSPTTTIPPPSFSNAPTPDSTSADNYTLKTMTVDGVERSYYVSASGPSKLLLWFHGTSTDTSVRSNFDDILSEYQVIQPIGLTNVDGMYSWQSVPGQPCNSDADDIAFVNALLDMYGTDSATQLYAGGFSVGSGFAARLSVDATMSSRFNGFIMCSSGIQATDLSKIAANGNTPNIFISNGDIDKISPVIGGTGTATINDVACYDFAALEDVVTAWATLECGSSSAIQTDSAGNQLYVNACGSSRVYAGIFKDTAHSSMSDSIASWISTMTGGSDKNLMTTALSILDGTLVI
jgi:hypothetical protein